MPWKESSVMDERLRFIARLLEGAPHPDIVTLRPGAVAQYWAQLEALATGGETDEAKAAFRNLIASVKVWPDYMIEIAGRLEAVTGCEAFPHGMKLGVFCTENGSERGT